MSHPRPSGRPARRTSFRTTPHRAGTLLIAALLLLLSGAPGRPAATAAVAPPARPGPAAAMGPLHRLPTISAAVHHDTSPPLRDLRPVPVLHHVVPLPVARPGGVARRGDGAGTAALHRNSLVTGLMPPPLQSFDGLGQGFSGPQGTFTDMGYPPDPNSAVGITEVVETVNASMAVFDKGGTVLYGPIDEGTVFSGFGGLCQNDFFGDPTVHYDHLANRWVLANMAATSPMATSGDECVAVSQTADPTGAYYRYAFSFTGLPDYAKLAVWPDAYYLTTDVLEPQFTPTFCALDRAAMLAGATASAQCFSDPYFNNPTPGLHDGEAPEPADLDGTILPPAGSPEFFVEADVFDWPAEAGLILWTMHVDWATPANSTLSGPTLLNAPYTDACTTGVTLGQGGGCIPEPGTDEKLDALGALAMYRLAYRNFGDHQSLVTTVAAQAGGTIGVQWFEIRNPATAPVIYQQGFYAPDSNDRWLGSAATDQSGDMAIGFSLSSSTVYPSIHYAGRLANDPLGQMAQGEGTILDGTTAQVSDPLNDPNDSVTYRWGDYSSMAIDPADDCTFWYTNEYISAEAPNTAYMPTWKTHIASFRFPSCGVSAATSTPTATATPTNTATPTETPTDTATASDTPTDTATNTAVPSTTPTDTATNTAVPPTATASATTTDTPTSTPMPTDTPTDTATASDTPTDTATATSTATDTPAPTLTPTTTPAAVVAAGPTSATPFQTITLTGTNFGAAETVKVFWDSPRTTLLVTPTTTLAGGFVAAIRVPQATLGAHALIAVGQHSGKAAYTVVHVTPAVLLYPSVGQGGSVAYLIGVGFGGNEAVAGLWYPGLTLLHAASSNTVGTVIMSFTVPLSPTGVDDVVGYGLTSKGVAVAPFRVSAQAQAAGVVPAWARDPATPAGAGEGTRLRLPSGSAAEGVVRRLVAGGARGRGVTPARR